MQHRFRKSPENYLADIEEKLIKERLPQYVLSNYLTRPIIERAFRTSLDTECSLLPGPCHLPGRDMDRTAFHSQYCFTQTLAEGRVGMDGLADLLNGEFTAHRD